MFLFSWMPMPADLAQEDWNRFLNGYAPLFLVILLVTIAVTLLGYFFSSRGRRIHSVADVFRPYTPLLWLLTAVAGGIVAAIVCALQFRSVLPGSPGGLSTSAMMLLVFCVVAALISYLLIAFVPLLTPNKFRYRPAPFLHRKSTVR